VLGEEMSEICLRFFPRGVFVALVLLIMGGGSQAYADIYRYEAENGEVILTTSPLKGYKLLGVIRSQDPGKAKKSPDRTSARDTSSTLRSGTAPAGSSGFSEATFDGYIEEASRVYGIPVAFIKAVIKVESNFNPRAVSYAGAMGLMQLMPGTARQMGVEDVFDPRQNILGGTRYLRRLSDRFNGDINLVLSGYHAGPGNVEKFGGIPFEATQRYVRNVYSWYLKYRAVKP
jgi:soluble lytic murein transglycosylase-like protein